MSAVALHSEVTGRLDGTAPVVVLLGSLGSTLRMWDGQVPALAAAHAVLAVDHRGHGGSPTPPGPYAVDDLVDDVLALLDRLGVGAASFVGLSLGGAVSMRLAARAPERVDRLALLCTSADFGAGEPWLARAAAVRAAGTASIAPQVVARWFTPAYAEGHADVVARAEAMVAGIDDEGYAGACEAIAALDLAPDLPRISAPTLLVAGKHDPATPPGDLLTLAAGIPASRLVVLDTAHLAALEAPQAVAAALTAHLGAPVPAGGPADDASLARGFAVRREVLGDAHVDRSIAAATHLTADFQEFLTRYAWGDVWARDGLDRRQRSMVTLAVLLSLGHEHELAMHVRAARRNGLTEAEIGEVFLHCALYAGLPAANRAFAIAQEVLEHSGGEGGTS